MMWAAVGLRSIMAMIALYESALYIFVFLWTPALESRAEAAGITSIPHGIIFSLFMVRLFGHPRLRRARRQPFSRVLVPRAAGRTQTCKMAGSQVFTLVLKGPTHAAHVLAFTFVLSALCFSVPLLSQSYYATLVAFSVYECGLGLYWPAIAILRADLVRAVGSRLRLKRHLFLEKSQAVFHVSRITAHAIPDT